MPSFRKGDKILLLDGRPGEILTVLKTEIKTIYKIKLNSMDEGYFESDKIILHQQHPFNSFLDRLGRLIPKL